MKKNEVNNQVQNALECYRDGKSMKVLDLIRISLLIEEIQDLLFLMV